MAEICEDQKMHNLKCDSNWWRWYHIVSYRNLNWIWMHNCRPPIQRPQNVTWFSILFFLLVAYLGIEHSCLQLNGSISISCLSPGCGRRPKFKGFRSSLTALSQVWLGLPGGRLQAAGSLWIAAAMMWWWSSHDKQEASLCESCSLWERGGTSSCDSVQNT